LSLVRPLYHSTGIYQSQQLSHETLLDNSATAGILGGAIYDAILGHCALKAGAETIYTWNTKDFLRLSAPIAGRVKTPDQAGI
jgi:predicted nucleic acid-binding protein